MSKIRLVIIAAAAFVVCLICSSIFIVQNMFSYTNLADASSRDLARSMLEEADVPQENIDMLCQLIEDFYQDPYFNIVTSGFQRGIIPFFSYRDADAFQHLELQPDHSITCRMAAFILLKDSIIYSDYETSQFVPDEKDPLSRQCLTDAHDLLHYDLLFSSLSGEGISSSADMSTALIEYWESVGIVFPDDAAANILTAYGSSGETVQNFHTAVVLQREDGIWLLEKYNPIFPFQLSCFSNEAQLINYMRSRVAGMKYAALFLGNDCLWSK